MGRLLLVTVWLCCKVSWCSQMQHQARKEAMQDFYFEISTLLREVDRQFLLWKYISTLRGREKTFTLTYFLCAEESCVGWDVFKCWWLLYWHGFLSVHHLSFFLSFFLSLCLSVFSFFFLSYHLSYFALSSVLCCFCLKFKSSNKDVSRILIPPWRFFAVAHCSLLPSLRYTNISFTRLPSSSLPPCVHTVCTVLSVCLSGLVLRKVYSTDSNCCVCVCVCVSDLCWGPRVCSIFRYWNTRCTTCSQKNEAVWRIKNQKPTTVSSRSYWFILNSWVKLQRSSSVKEGFLTLYRRLNLFSCVCCSFRELLQLSVMSRNQCLMFEA